MKDFRSALETGNPAKTYYEMCQNKLSIARQALGIETPQKNKQTIEAPGGKGKELDKTETSESEKETDEQVFEGIFGSEEAG